MSYLPSRIIALLKNSIHKPRISAPAVVSASLLREREINCFSQYISFNSTLTRMGGTGANDEDKKGTQPKLHEDNNRESNRLPDSKKLTCSFESSACDVSLMLEQFRENNPKELNFVSRINPTTGKMEWVELPEDYDYHQEIARSAYADMLHDHDRNIRYFEALKYEIAKLKSQGKPAHVLDIGTGTGLLSMMAVVAGADSVFACDAFSPMLDCARKVVKRNGFENKIKLIPKRSTELKVGVDLPYRCNILVTEVFDTELIGEGAISTFNHAHKELLTETAVVIPEKSTVYAQVVHSKEVEKWNSLPKELTISSSMKIKYPESISTCAGVPSVQDLQLDAINTTEFVALSPPIPIFSFNFTSPDPISDYRTSEKSFLSESNGEANAVFMWWDLDMDTSGNNVLSCQPAYVKQGPSHWFSQCPSQNAAWRDHWMHSMYYIPRSQFLKTDEKGTLFSAHDEYSFWFDITKENIKETLQFPKQHPICECGFHMAISRSQMYLMNDTKRYEKFVNCYQKLIVPDRTICVCISDCSVLPLILAKLGAKKVFVIESCRENERISKEIFYTNEISNQQIEFLQIEEVEKELNSKLKEMKVELVTGDPYFQMTVYPWNSLRFWYQLKALNSKMLSPDVTLAPYKAALRGIAVNFTHLWKIRSEVNTAAYEFDLTDFDKLIEHSATLSDSDVDAQPLWEYESKATSMPITIFEFDMTKDPEDSTVAGSFNVPKEYTSDTNGIALWIDWILPNGEQLSTGPKVFTELGKPIIWERYSKQGVYFLTKKLSEEDKIDYKISFDSETADFINIAFITKTCI